MNRTQTAARAACVKRSQQFQIRIATLTLRDGEPRHNDTVALLPGGSNGGAIFVESSTVGNTTPPDVLDLDAGGSCIVRPSGY